jgi:hypothetical protein
MISFMPRIAGVVVVLLSLLGCSNDTSEPLIEFSASLEEGGEVTALVQYKQEACFDENSEPVGCYYYIVRVNTSADFDGRIGHYGRPVDPEHSCYFSRVHMSFYDSNGFSLYWEGIGANFDRVGNYFSPVWNTKPDESMQIPGGWEWKGRFPETNLPFSQFDKITTMKAELGGGC